jgi:hypothetical protein
LCRSKYARVVADDAGEGFAVFQAVQQLPDREAAAVGVEPEDGSTAIQRNARVAGEKQARKGWGPWSVAVFLVGEAFEEGGGESTGSVAAKGGNSD